MGTAAGTQLATRAGAPESKRRNERGWHATTLHADPKALAERERRLAVAPRDLTAALFGDPLPGYSALDRRAAGGAQP